MECYLCGAENPFDADFCSRCDGQLLRVGETDAPEDAFTEPETELDEVEQRLHEIARLPSMRSAEDSRLHDALGLGLDDEDVDEDADGPARKRPRFSIPKVETTEIPVIGTRTATFGTSGALQQGVSKRAAAGLVVLAMLVAILGYRTLTHEPTTEPDTPDNLAFSNSTLAPPPSTAPAVRPWTQGEIVGKFAPAFVTVNLYECPAELAPRGETEPIEVRASHGVVIDENNVVFAAADFPEVDVAVIRSKSGNLAVSLINRHESGVSVATTYKSLNKTLSLVEMPEGKESYFISHDPDSSTTAVGEDLESVEEAQAAVDGIEEEEDAEREADIAIETLSISATDQGDATAVWVGDLRLDLETLLDIARYETEVADGEQPAPRTLPCNDGAILVDATEPAPTDGGETSAADDTTTADTSQ